MDYTKGEWQVELFNKDRGEQGGYFVGNGEIPIATMTSVPEIKANAQLISAAPELYEAVRQALIDIDRTGYTKVPHIVEMQKALAKAEGK